MGAECIFCRIINREIHVDFLYEDEHFVAFRDANPVAPVHVLIIPRQHIAGILELSGADDMGPVLQIAKKLANYLGIAGTGLRVVVNTGADAGQSVQHIHFHLLGGRAMGWPPG